MLYGLAELPFPLVITTNYDRLLENALGKAGKLPRVAGYTPRLEATTDHRNPAANSPIVFKIHGDIAHPATIVITDEDYIQFVLRMSRGTIRPGFAVAEVLFNGVDALFVGYSLLDYNLRLLFKTLRWKSTPPACRHVFVDCHPDPLIVSVWHEQRRYVKFIAEDVWAFVPKLYELVLGRN